MTTRRPALTLLVGVMALASCTSSGGDEASGPATTATTATPPAPASTAPTTVPPAPDLAGGSWVSHEAPPPELGRSLVLQGAGKAVLALGEVAAARFDIGASGWELLSEPPGSPRDSPVSVWTGRSWLLLGGWTPAGDTATDGIVWDADDERWSVVPDAPFVVGDAVAADGGVVATDQTGGAVARLDLDPMAWEVLSAPPSPGEEAGGAEIVASDDGLLLFRTIRPPMDYPTSTALRFDGTSWRSAGPTSEQLATEVVATPWGPVGRWQQPCMPAASCPQLPTAVAASFDSDTGWLARPSSNLTGWGPPVVWTGRFLVLSGAVWDPATGEWSALPDPGVGLGEVAGMAWAGGRLVAVTPDATLTLRPGSTPG